MESSESDYNVHASRSESQSHVIILHERLAKKRSDRYIVNLAMAYHKIGYKVTIMTSHFNVNDCIEDIQFVDKVDIKYTGWWIPRSVCGLFKSNMSSLKAAWMAYRIIFFPPEPKPLVIVLDVSIWAMYILKMFTRYKLFYLENFASIKNLDNLSDNARMQPTLFEAKWIKLADEIIVETAGFAEIFKKSYPSISKAPKILYQSIDIGLWNEPVISINRIIPDLLENTILFLAIGKYKRSSNFRLALEAFEILLELIDDKTVTKRFQLVIAGNCKTADEKFFYNEMLLSTREKLCASQVTFLKQLPIIHEKTLLVESAILIHPAKNDLYSDFLLRAMCLGKPVVATTKGIASRLLVHRLSGVLTEPEPRMVAVALKKLMLSPHLQIFLGDMARDAFYRTFSFDAMCDKLTGIMAKYQSIDMEPVIPIEGYCR